MRVTSALHRGSPPFKGKTSLQQLSSRLLQCCSEAADTASPSDRQEGVHMFGPEIDPLRFYLRQRAGSEAYYISRKPVRSLHTSDLLEAQQAYDKLIPLEPSENGAIRNKDAFPTWVESHRLAESTRKIYRGVWNNWCKPIHGKLVSEVSTKHIIRILREAEITPSAKTGKPMTADGLNHIYVCLSS